MKKTIIRFFKRLYINMLILNRKYSYDANQPVSQTQKMSMSIAKKLIKHPESKFDIGPKSGKKYITNSELKLFIIFDKRVLSITNHVYHYTVKMTDKTFRSIANTFDKKVEGIRSKYETEIHNQIQHSLVNVLEKLNS